MHPYRSYRLITLTDCLEVLKAGLGTHTEASVAKDPQILRRYLQVARSYLHDTITFA